jgi:O-antigen biosynthesis protein
MNAAPKAAPLPRWHTRLSAAPADTNRAVRLAHARSSQRPRISGKFVAVGEETLYLRGVTYGAFQPGPDGSEYHNLDVIKRDFDMMAANGINAVRIPHTTPPSHLLDIAKHSGLRVMAGLSCEQLIGFLEDKEKGFDYVEHVIREKVRSMRRHPALLCYALGNEIPAPMVRWHGRRRVERYLERLYFAVKQEDPEGLVTYVNYPSTEYLQLSFLDLVCFNVYLESRTNFEAYLARLHNIAGNRPLIMSEIGLDSLRNGCSAQAQSLDWQIRTAFRAGCAGAFVFSWTDEWCRAGTQVEDWAFGITDRERRPKPALLAIRDAYAEVPFPDHGQWPAISVVVCTHNGSRTLRECCEDLRRLQYPNFEVIVVNDGSSDDSEQIAREYDFQVITTENQGLSAARNTGMRAAKGEIVAYIDDDVCPGPQWLTYLANSFMSTRHVGIGGPNIPLPTNSAVTKCVAYAPGGPIHVLLSDTVAEHIPGCNMAFRKSALEAVGGFDKQFRVAGDDVDLCWRLQERGWTIGFTPAAMVWHHTRNSIRRYWKQQFGYGRAEAMLERKWPEKYNSAGHVRWTGRMYGQGLVRAFGRVERIYYGSWCSAPFQTLQEEPPGLLLSCIMTPEWHLAVAVLALLSGLGLLWRPLLAFIPILLAALGALVAQAISSSAKARFAAADAATRLRLPALTAFLYLTQPVARLAGRLTHGLTPWRRRPGRLAFPWPRKLAIWSEHWCDPEARLMSLQSALRSLGAAVSRGGDYDAWDLEIRKATLGSVRIVMGAEDHGAGKQYVRFRFWPRFSSPATLAATLLMAGAYFAGSQHSYSVSVVFLCLGSWLLCRTLQACAAATATVRLALENINSGAVTVPYADAPAPSPNTVVYAALKQSEAVGEPNICYRRR